MVDNSDLMLPADELGTYIEMHEERGFQQFASSTASGPGGLTGKPTL